MLNFPLPIEVAALREVCGRLRERSALADLDDGLHAAGHVVLEVAVEEPRAPVGGLEPEPDPAAAGEHEHVLEDGLRDVGGQRPAVVELAHRPGARRAAGDVAQRAHAHAGEGGAVQVHRVSQQRVGVVLGGDVGVVHHDDVDGPAVGHLDEVRAVAHRLVLAAEREPALAAVAGLARLRQEGRAGIRVRDAVEGGGQVHPTEGYELLVVVVVAVEQLGQRQQVELEPEEDELLRLGPRLRRVRLGRVGGAQLCGAHLAGVVAVSRGVDHRAGGQLDVFPDGRRGGGRQPGLGALVDQQRALLREARVLAEADGAHVDPVDAGGPRLGLPRDHRVPALAREGDERVGLLRHDVQAVGRDDGHGVPLELDLDGAAQRAGVDDAEAVAKAGLDLEGGVRREGRVAGGGARVGALAVDEDTVGGLAREAGGEPREDELGGDVHPVLEDDDVLGDVNVVPVAGRVVLQRLPDDEGAHHAVHLVQARVRVPEVGAGGLGQELVAEGAAVDDGALRDERHAVEPRRLLLRQPVPVDGLGVAREVHLEVHDDRVSAAHVDAGTGQLPVDRVHGALHAVREHAVVLVALRLVAGRAIAARRGEHGVHLLGEHVVACPRPGVLGAVTVARTQICLPSLRVGDLEGGEDEEAD